MKIFSTSSVAKIDSLTSIYEPISSVDLMERASLRITEALIAHYPHCCKFAVFAGTGNNGGDGLVVARLLFKREYNVKELRVLSEWYLDDSDEENNFLQNC